MRAIGLLFGLIFGAIGIALLIGGVALVAVFGPGRDEDGFVYSPTYRLSSSGHALISERLDLAPYPGDWLPADVATARFNVQPADGQEIFVGIGPSVDVARYLDDVAYDRIDHIGWRINDVRYDTVAGGAPTTAPGDQEFWVAEATSTRAETLDWDVERGDWTVVVMNADGSAGVAVSTEFGVSIPALLWIGIGLIVVGLFVGLLAGVFLAGAFRSRRRALPAR